MSTETPKQDESTVLRYILNCRSEADRARFTRMRLNENNYNMYHLEHDFSHKEEGQSTEILSKVKMAVEQTRHTLQQSLAEFGDWWSAIARDGTDGSTMLIKPEEVQALTNYMLKKSNYYGHVGNSLWYALLGAISISKVYGKLTPKPKYEVVTSGKGKGYAKKLQKIEDKAWELCFDEIRQANYYPDPTAGGLYEITDIFIDKHKVLALCEGDYAIYDKKLVQGLSSWGDTEQLKVPRKEEETGQDKLPGTFRNILKLTEFYGNIVDPNSGELLFENVYATLANDTVVIREPTPNPYWHQGSDLVTAPLMEIPNSVWHTALMDAPTMHNEALIEIYNLIVDSAMKQTHGVNQIRPDWLQDPSQVSDGIPFGTTLKVNSQCPPGAKVMEPVTTGEISPQALNVMNIQQQEFNAAALTNDIRSGITPARAQSATATVDQSNTINSVFTGIAKNLEVKQIQPELELAWKTICQNWDLIGEETFKAVFGNERGSELAKLDPEDVFAATVNGLKFEVYGITLTIKRSEDYKKLTTLMQTIGANQALLEAFMKDYSVEKFLGEIMSSLNINKLKIQNDPPPQLPPAGQPAPGGAPQPQPPAGGAPNQMSQVPAPPQGGGGLAAMLGGAPGGPQPAAGV